jgi:hypothetical protein
MTDTPTHPIDKELVAKRFSYSRSTYDREASVQRQVAEKMMRLLTDALLSAGIPRPPHRRAWLRNGQLLAHVAEHLATGNAVAERPLPGYGGMRQGAMHYAHSPRQLLAG